MEERGDGCEAGGFEGWHGRCATEGLVDAEFHEDHLAGDLETVCGHGERLGFPGQAIAGHENYQEGGSSSKLLLKRLLIKW